MNTTTTLFLCSDPAMYTSPGHTYARVGVRDPACMYVRGRIFFLAHWLLYVRVHATCAPLLRHVRASTSTSMYVHVRDQNDNATYASTRWVPTVRHFLARKDVAWKSFLDHIDHAAPRAPGRWTTARPRKGTTRRQGRLGSSFPRGGEYDCMRVYWFVCRRRRITAGVGE